MAGDDEGNESSDPRNWLLPELDDDELSKEAEPVFGGDTEPFSADQPAPTFAGETESLPADHPAPGSADQPEAPHGEMPPPPVEASTSAEAVQVIGESDEAPLSFGPDDTGPLPHWTAPPTGEVPRILGDETPAEEEAWSSLQSGPVWRDDRTTPTPGDDDVEFESLSGGVRLGALDERPAPADPFFDDEAEPEPLRPPEPRIEPDPARVTPIRTRRPAGVPSARRADDSGFTETRGTAGRDMGAAIGVGIALAALFLLLARAGPKYLMVLVVLALAAAAVEFYDKVREHGYQPATLVGLVAVAGLPLAAYWRGPAALPLVVFLAVVATLAWYMLAGSIEVNPTPNSAITLFGVVWIGLLGSYGALILQLPHGVETVVIAVVGTVAYDMGALFVGSAGGRTQMAPWISPNKTVEGLIGGMLAAVLAVVFCHFLNLDPWANSLGKTVELAIVVAIAAPLGDIAESMVKRNLGIKDFGTLLPGHGGALDRLDAMIFVAPAVYYLVLVAKPV